MIQRLEASSHWSRETSRNTLSVHFSSIIWGVTPSKLPRHNHFVGLAYHILALLIKHMLPVKYIFYQAHSYFLVATTYKHMCLTSSIYSNHKNVDMHIV